LFTTSTSAPFDVGSGPDLTPEIVWAGLWMRARLEDDRFAPPGHRFEVVGDDGATVMRKVYLADGREELQRITGHGDRLMVFEFVEGPQQSLILHAIETDDVGAYVLHMTFLTQFAGLAHGSVEEAEFAGQRRPMMRQQPGRVLEVVRELVAEGVLA
jgi:hypothetical protein